MAHRFERLTTETGSEEQIPFSGHHLTEVSNKDLSKELKEDDCVKMQFIDMLKDFIQKMTSGDNYEIIDTIVGKEGASAELAEDIEYFIEKIGSQNIVEKSSSVDFIRNVSTSMLAFVNRIIRKPYEGGLSQEKFEKYSKIIKDNYNTMKKYFNLMDKYNDFRSAEIGSHDGYIARVDSKNIGITDDKKKYADWAEDNLSGNKK